MSGDAIHDPDERESVGTVCGRFTVTDLAQLLGVTSARLRNWVRLGLIVPVETQCRLAYFDFAQVSLAKRLWELLTEGASLQAVRRGLERLRKWMPDEPHPLTQVVQFESRGRLLIRVHDLLVDVRGQQYFDFAASEEPSIDSAARFETTHSAAELFEIALAHEDAGQWADAAATYQRALTLEPADPVLHFNLGNVHATLGNFPAALSSYREAIRLDPQYAEAWNNLGLALANLNQLADAAESLRRAVGLVPDYLAAHRNLAKCLHRLGELQIADEHWDIADRLQRRQRLPEQTPVFRLVGTE